MAIPNTFSGGVNTSFSSELNTNFTYLENKVDETPKWNLLETLSPSSVATITTGTLVAYDQYLVIFDDVVCENASNQTFFMRFNGDTGANYDSLVGVTWATGQNQIAICKGKSTSNIVGEILIGGKTVAATSGELPCNISLLGGTNADIFLKGAWIGGNATQITSLTIFTLAASSDFSGTIKVYGRSF